jgi:hypothetical protein
VFGEAVEEAVGQFFAKEGNVGLGLIVKTSVSIDCKE